jgi:hypothetical protein
MSNEGGAETDEELLARLRSLIARADPVPEHVVDTARMCGSWRSVESDLALLTYDSASRSPELVGVRGAEGRLLSFRSDTVTVDLEILPGGAGIVGEIEGPRRARVDVRHSQGALHGAADDLGRFRVRDVPGGLLRLEITDEETARVTRTAWILV